ncbi:MAG: hypothetical protein IT373_31035 [Polyangiaceae bacterium]|nr:hypothetical protein [Polyangiaceae bacterium]
MTGRAMTAGLGLLLASVACSSRGSAPTASAEPVAPASAAPVAPASAAPVASTATSSAPSASASARSRGRREVSWWTVFEPYPGARPLCELRGLVPHTFTRVFASRDEADRVMRFYLDGRDLGMRQTATEGGMLLSNELDGEPQLEVAPVHGGIPEGCEPGPGEATLILITVWPGYRH